MKKLNIPSYSALIPRDHRIRSIMDLYYSFNGQSEEVGNFMDKATEFHKEVSDYMAKADAVFRGTFTSLTKLKAVTADANDYAWVSSKDSDGNTTYKHYRYVDGSGWTFEYTMTSPYFTADEWNSIQSGITSALVTKLSDLPTSTELTNTFSTKLDSSVFNSYKQTNDTAVASKVDKVEGKQLSANDYTTEEKNKLAGIAEGAEVNVNADWNATEGDAQILNKPTKVSSFENDSGYLTEHQSLADYVKTDDSRLSDSRNAKDVYSWAKAATKPTYTKSEIGLGNVDNTSDKDKPISTATQTALDKKVDTDTFTEEIDNVKLLAVITAVATYCETTTIENAEWKYLLTDSEDKILLGVKEDGTFYKPDGITYKEIFDFIVENTPAKSGTFANAPASPVAGQSYFCTDKQTTEGAANGIMLYYNGTSWTDALGRAITTT